MGTCKVGFLGLRRTGTLDMEFERVSDERLFAREKRMAAFHEVCHAWLLRRFGGDGSPRIWPNPSANEEECAWLGRCEVWYEPGAVDLPPEVVPARRVVNAPTNWRTLFGMAGYLGERLADGVRDSGEIAVGLDDAIDAGEISASDIEAIGVAWTEDDVAEAVRLLAEVWPFVEEEARWMIDAEGP